MSYIEVGTSFPSLKDKVVIVTGEERYCVVAYPSQASRILGGSAGIGLTTVELFRTHGAKVVVGDLQPPPNNLKTAPNPSELSYSKTDVTSWKSLSGLFAETFDFYGRIDIVFANAGINEREDIFLDKFDSEGQLQEPSYEVLDVNLKSVLSTAKLATHYFAKNTPSGGKLIITGSFAGGLMSSGHSCVSDLHALNSLLR
jgi:NAD(P)-dependent dehydrogenase (short-subunit alcohol dehydrogenase family)